LTQDLTYGFEILSQAQDDNFSFTRSIHFKDLNKMTRKTLLPVLSSDSGFHSYLREINRIPSLSQEEEYLLAKSYLEHNDLQAAQKLVTSHLKLVVKIALSYRNYGLPITELVSEGNLGLMQAVKKYNPELGFRLSTYSMWWIKAAIQEYVLKSWSLVKIGTTSAQKRLFFSLNKIKKKLSNLYARPVGEQDFPEIAKAIGVETADVKEMNSRLAGGDLSLNATVDRDNQSAELMEFLPETRPNQEIRLIDKEESSSKYKMLTQAIKILGERELDIFTRRKLIEKPDTLDELSNEYKISKERVRQIENRAFEKIRDHILAHVTREYAGPHTRHS
jgi:RNA polymerase sigma-32 factor